MEQTLKIRNGRLDYIGGNIQFQIGKIVSDGTHNIQRDAPTYLLQMGYKGLVSDIEVPRTGEYFYENRDIRHAARTLVDDTESIRGGKKAAAFGHKEVCTGYSPLVSSTKYNPWVTLESVENDILQIFESEVNSHLEKSEPDVARVSGGK